MTDSNAFGHPDSRWTHPVCWPCWRARNGDDVPTRLRTPEPELCCWCGQQTDSGIYLRADPNTLDHCPRRECRGCHPSGGELYRRGETIRQQTNGDLVCTICGRVTAPAEASDVT